MKMIKITQCRDNSMWYSKLVGTLVPFLGAWTEGFKSRECKSVGGYLNIIKFEDGVVVDV